MHTLDAAVVVVGGGISGLTCAWHLQQHGLDVAVVESASRAGGSIGSAREDGCLIEAGPNSALETTPLIPRLLQELGIFGERILAGPAARNRFVLRHGKLIALPLAPLHFLATPLFSFAAKLRLLAEPCIAAQRADIDESVASFVRRRLGREFLDYAIDPFVAGVYAGDPEILSIKAAFPRLYALEQTHGSLFRGYLAGSRARDQSKLAAPMFSFREGMQTLTDALAARIHRIILSSNAVNIAPCTSGYSVTVETAGGRCKLSAPAVVVATPAYAAARLISAVSPAAADALAAIPYPPVTVVCSAYPRAAMTNRLDGFGVLVPKREGRPTLGTLFSSSLFANSAPPGLVLLTTFIGGMRQQDVARLDEAKIFALVQAQQAAVLGAPARAEFMRLRRWERAIPQYSIGHLDRMDALDRAEKDLPGIFFCANYRGGVAIGDCVKSGHSMAETVAEFFGTRSLARKSP